MGNLLLTHHSEEGERSFSNNSSKKRTIRECDSDDEEVICPDTFKRKKIKTTSNYIYNALYLAGENSDITVRALDCEWKLHKVYLRQAGYFNGMFHGSWKESSMKVIDLQIPDDNIDKEALHIAFGSLYSDEVEVSPSHVISVLAAASLIQLEGLMEQCSNVMMSAVSCKNVCCFYKEARLYGQPEVEHACLTWLENNLMLKMKNSNLLPLIDENLMTRVIGTHLSKEENLHSTVTDKMKNSEIKTYFSDVYRQTGKVFLESEIGLPFVPVFRAVRFCNIMRDFGCCIEMEKDCIVPQSWLVPLYRDRWLTMLRVEQGVDVGPGQSSHIDRDSLRCGRILVRDADHCWRWNGYNFGFDLLVTYSCQPIPTLCLKRNVHSQRRVASAGMSVQRKIIYLLKVFSLDENGKVVDMFSVGPSRLVLEQDEEKTVLKMEKNNGAKRRPDFPLMISACFRVVSGNDMGNSSYTICPSMTLSRGEDAQKAAPQ